VKKTERERQREREREREAEREREREREGEREYVCARVREAHMERECAHVRARKRKREVQTQIDHPTVYISLLQTNFTGLKNRLLKIQVVCHVHPQGLRLIVPFFVWRFCSCSGLSVRIPGLFCVKGVLRIFIERKLSNLSAFLDLSPVNM